MKELIIFIKSEIMRLEKLDLTITKDDKICDIRYKEYDNSRLNTLREVLRIIQRNELDK